RPLEYKFEIPVKITPLKQTYALTDTIWIETNQTDRKLFDLLTNTLVTMDTGYIYFGAAFNQFGTRVVNPPDGFCDVITPAGVNIGRNLGQFGTGIAIEYGCGQPDYKVRIGLLPHYRGTFSVNSGQQLLLQQCPGQTRRYYAEVNFKYEGADLGLNIFNSLSSNDQGGKDGRKFYRDKIAAREYFVFRVN
ncbi:MAG: hypothetical protein ABI480_09645, partial [Chitinophagaceae bacterium]